MELDQRITATIKRLVADSNTLTRYREALVGFVSAGDVRFGELTNLADAGHLMPHHLLPGARSVVSFFLPFEHPVVDANAVHPEQVAWEWVVAYRETNALIGRIVACLIEQLGDLGVGAAAEPATRNFDPVTLTSRWSHKSVAVVAGLGSFGLHHMVITDAGCAGRFGSLVVDADLPATAGAAKQRCLYFYDGSCQECVSQCPAGALNQNGEIDKYKCWAHIGKVCAELGVPASVCGKCVIGLCSFENPVG